VLVNHYKFIFQNLRFRILTNDTYVNNAVRFQPTQSSEKVKVKMSLCLISYYEMETNDWMEV
jgi:hypothetical protein